jgi:site-specific DNA recombinase
MADRAFRYHRVSDQKAKTREDVYSLSEQEAMTAAYCQEKGYEDVGDCREIHTGAELDERPGMSKVRAMIRRREFDVLVLISLDRLARNTNHLEVVLYECERYGVRVELVTETFENTPIGRHIRSTLGLLAELERDHIKERTQRGVRGRIKSGKIMPGSRPIYGYRWTHPGKGRKEAFVINPETAPIVQRIFREAAEGKALRRIAIDLTDEGVLSPSDYWRQVQGLPIQGAPWQKSAVWRILINPAYCGQHSAFTQEVRRRKDFTEFGEPITRQYRVYHDVGDGHRIPLPDACPPIISPEIALAVRHRLELNREASARNNKHPEATLLRGGFIKCAQCGRNMMVGYESRNAGGAILYRCYRPGDRLYGITTCKGTRVVAAELDAEVWGWVLWVMQRPELIEEQIKLNEHGGYAETIEGYNHRIADLDRQQKQLSRAIGMLDESESDALIGQYKHVGQQKREAEHELQELLARQWQYESWQEQMRQVTEWCAAMSDFEWTYERKRQALYAFGVQVTVWPNNHKPRWKVRIGHRGKPIDPEAIKTYCVSSVHPEGHAQEILDFLAQEG